MRTVLAAWIHGRRSSQDAAAERVELRLSSLAAVVGEVTTGRSLVDERVHRRIGDVVTIGEIADRATLPTASNAGLLVHPAGIESLGLSSVCDVRMYAVDGTSPCRYSSVSKRSRDSAEQRQHPVPGGEGESVAKEASPVVDRMGLGGTNVSELARPGLREKRREALSNEATISLHQRYERG